MPGRRTYFSFHYEQDVWRATIVRNAGKVDATAAAGWNDASLWEEAKRKGSAEIQHLIDAALEGSSVTAVLIGADTASRPWVTYEIDKSIERGNGLLGVRIHGIKNQDRKRSRRGPAPAALIEGGYPVYNWNRSSLGRWVEHAAIAADKPCLRHQTKQCRICRKLWWW